MSSLLEPPPLPEAQRASSTLSLRYDDVDQQGRLKCVAAGNALDAIWSGALLAHPLMDWCREARVLPILSRLVIERDDGPFSVATPLDVEGGYALSHVGGEAGVERIVLSMWAALRGPTGETHAPAVVGPEARAARVYAEHVFTAPFAPPAERKVTRLGGVGVPAVPPQRYVAEPADAYASPPPGAAIVGAPSVAPFLFGLGHTDSNQHVNSFVYLRLADEAATAALAACGAAAPRLARRVEIGYRKPFFAGERAQIAMTPFRDQTSTGGAGTIAPLDKPDRASSWVRITYG